MKAKYLKLFLILMLVVNLGLGCSSPEIKEKVTATKPTSKTTTKPGPKIMRVQYIVIASERTSKPEVSVTYNNAQGGTSQKNGLVLEKSLEEVFKNTDIKSTSEDCEKCRGEVIASYNHFPKDEFLYISAQNQKDHGGVVVYIIVNGRLWKFSDCIGEYCITDANGYYDK